MGEAEHDDESMFVDLRKSRSWQTRGAQPCKLPIPLLHCLPSNLKDAKVCSSQLGVCSRFVSQWHLSQDALLLRANFCMKILHQKRSQSIGIWPITLGQIPIAFP